MESEQEDRRGILQVAYVVVTMRGVHCPERVRADVKCEMSALGKGATHAVQEQKGREEVVNGDLL